jgi:3-deoxy-D-arabino-heptulosonate 7-phosphate (DAHP) synthase
MQAFKRRMIFSVRTAGKDYMVIPLACAAISAGADGIIVEAHDQPQHALAGGFEALTPEQHDQMIFEVRAIYAVMLMLLSGSFEQNYYV